MSESRQIINGGLIRLRRAELGLSSRAIAAALGVTGSVVQRLEAGDNHLDVTMGLLVKLAAVLAVDVVDLVSPTPSESSEGTVASDVAAVGALLHAAGVSTPAGALRDSLGWDQARLIAAIEGLDEQLRSVGMRLKKNGVGHVIVRDLATTSPDTLAKLIRAHVTRDGLNRTEAALLYRIHTTGAPRDPSNPEAVALGALVNAQLLVPGVAPTGTAERPLVLADMVCFSLLLDEVD